jgi:hypothetical protein
LDSSTKNFHGVVLGYNFIFHISNFLKKSQERAGFANLKANKLETAEIKSTASVTVFFITVKLPVSPFIILVER